MCSLHAPVIIIPSPRRLTKVAIVPKMDALSLERQKKGHTYNVHKDREGPDKQKRPLSTSKPVTPRIFDVPNDSNYFPSGLVHCCVMRGDTGRGDGSAPSRLRTRYTFTFQVGKQSVAMIAEKQPGTRFSQYYIFDANRGGASAKLSKKAGHYIGKLRREGTARAGYSLYDSKEERQQVAAFVYQAPSLVEQWRDGQPPRRMQLALPHNTGGDSSEVTQEQCMVKIVAAAKECDLGLRLFVTKKPSYEGGQFRLNFGGRVTIPSVKNMQIETADANEQGLIIAQFGKVGDGRFHLDYKAPLSAFQAFAMALTQFDL